MAAKDATSGHLLTDATVATSIDPDSSVDVTVYLSTDRVDGDNEVVLPAGCDLSRFDKNAPLLLCHDYKGQFYPLPVGQVLWVKKRTNGLLGGVRFARNTAMGREVKALVEERVLRGVSVGFLPTEQSPMTKAEAATRPDWLAAFDRTRGRINVIRKWVLTELSLTPIPCNEDALVQVLKTKGMARPEWVKSPASEAEPMSDEPHDHPEPETPLVAKAYDPDADGDDDGDGHDEPEGPVRNGHFVKVTKGPHRGVVGKVKSVHRSGLVPDVEDDVPASKAEPGVRVNVYKAMGDGHKESAHHVGCKMAHCEKTDDLKGPSRKKGIDPLSLPPLAGKSDEQIAAETLARVRAELGPAGVKQLIERENDRRLGAV